MAKLSQLHISGIRNFVPSEEDAQQLAFAPLTLIVGANGCGKTTIIEAVSYVCCGELQGPKKEFQDFVSEPKLHSGANTKGKGQIKLTVVDSSGNQITAVKNVGIEKGKKGPKFKSKPAELVTRTPAGEISTCLEDSTNKFSRMMKVSPAVLNNVIFCHQENATWPFSEGHKLKEKFDEIFETEKYKECLNKLKKEKDLIDGHISKLLKPQFVEAEEKYKHVQKQTKELEDKTKKIKELQNEIKIKNEELTPVKKQLDEIRKFDKFIQNLEKQISSKEALKGRVIQEQKDIARNIETEFNGSDEELENLLKKEEFNRQNEETFIRNLENLKTSTDSKIKQTKISIEEAQIELGTLTQEQNIYQKKCNQRRKLLFDILKEDTKRDNKKAKALITKLKQILAVEEDHLHYLIESKEKLKEEWQEVIEKTRETKLIAENNIKTKQKQIEEYKIQHNDISRKLNEFSNFDEDLKKCLEQIEETNIQITQTNKNLSETEINERRRTDIFNKKIEDYELLLNRLQHEKNTLLNKEITQKKIENEKNFIQRKEEEWEDFTRKHSQDLKQIFKDKPPRYTLTEAVLEKQRIAEAASKNLSTRITTIEKEIATLEVLRKRQMDEITNCEKQLEAKENTIAQVCNNENFNEIFDNSLQQHENLLWDKRFYSAMQTIFDGYIKEFEKREPRCPVCLTDFTSRNDLVGAIIMKLRNELEKLPQKLNWIEEKLKEEEILYKKLQNLKGVNEEIELLLSEIPLLRSQLEEIDQNLDKESAELDELQIKLEEPEKIVEICRNMITEVASLNQNSSEIEYSKRTVENLEKDLSAIVLDKTKEEIEAEISTTTSKIEEIKRYREQQAVNISKCKDNLLNLRQKKTVLLEKKEEYLEAVRSKSHFEELASEIRDKTTKLQEEIDKFQKTVDSSEEELKNAIENKEKEMTNYDVQIQTDKNKIESHQKIRESIERLQNEIDDYLNNQLGQKLVNTKNNLETFKALVTRLEETKTETINKISEKRIELSGQKQKFRELEDNAILRSKRVEEAALDSEIENLRHQLENINNTNNENKCNLNFQSEILEKKINRLEGEMSQISSTIKELEEDLRKSEYQDALQNFKRKSYEVKVAENILLDLSKYIEGLERAIFEFHRTKLKQINERMKELWQNIYRGNDVDYIQIQEVVPEEKAKKQNWSYKIVQFKNGVKFDMRKRCSVGQKNLACLIIRMALAETLSSNCGILALDEPTANLDRENIQSLCETLSTIINQRKEENNFQLLIITHDEEFLNTLIREQGVSFYYRVTRDKDGFSRINKESFRF